MNPDDETFAYKRIQQATTSKTRDSQYGVASVPAHTHNGTDSLVVDFRDLTNRVRYIVYRAVASTTDLTVATVGGSFVMPFSGKIIAVGATVDTAGTTGTMTVDIKNAGTSIMANTKIILGSGQTDSRNYTTSSPKVTSPFFYTKDIFTFLVTAVQGTVAKGLTVWIQVIEVGP